MMQPISDDDLDRLLAAAAPRVEPEPFAAAEQLARLTRQTADEEAAARRPRRRRRVVLAAVASAVVLCGAGTVTAYELSIPPFQSLDPGLFRLRPAIVIDYPIRPGVVHRCEAFPEFINLTDAQEAAARDWADDQDWTGYGDTLADEARAVRGVVDESSVLNAFGADLRGRLVEQILPGISQDPVRANQTGAPALAGYAASCRTVTDGD